MWLETSEATETPLWEGPLELVDESAAERGDAAGEIERLRRLPTLSIGRPATWPLVDLVSDADISPAVRSRLSDYALFLIRLSCSFRVRPDDATIEWARFGISLQPDAAGRRPIAFDVHPVAVTHEVQRDVKVALQPTLKFGPVDAGSAEAGIGLQYTVLEPVISAAGVGEPDVSWDYEASHGSRVQGSKWMHLLVEAPLDAEAGEAVIDLSADIAHAGRRLPAVIRRRESAAADALHCRLWG